MTTEQAATVLGLSLRTVQAHIKRGNLKAEKRGRDWWIEADEVERFRQTRRGRGKPKQEPTP